MGSRRVQSTRPVQGGRHREVLVALLRYRWARRTGMETPSRRHQRTGGNTLVIGNVSRRLPLVEWAARLGGLLALCFSASVLAAPALSFDLVATNPPGTQYTPGTVRAFEFTVSNSNAQGVTGVTDMNVELALPADVTLVTSPAPTCSVITAGSSPASSCGTAGSGAVLFTGADVGVGGSIRVRFSSNFGSAAVGTKIIQAKVTGPAAGSASIAMTSPAAPAVKVSTIVENSPAPRCPGAANDDKYTPGCKSRYLVEVTNAGPGNTLGASLNLGLAENSTFTTIRWSCTVAGTATCPEGISPKPSWCPGGGDTNCGEGPIINKAVSVNGGPSPTDNMTCRARKAWWCRVTARRST